jgi:cellulose synthase/poly-beta-1,6-N-acetylglucosamine synthase-like glycosyltransferase
MIVAYVVLASASLLAVYAYAGYPLVVYALGRGRKESEPRSEPETWPSISFSVPAYNEEEEIGATLDALLAIDYPADRRQIIIVSDASTDRTDAIVESYADRGVVLVRQPERRGKTAAEALAAEHVAGDVVINTDASIRIAPDAIKPLVARFQDPAVGVASGRDVSISRLSAEQNVGEAGYVGYEMAVRTAETRLYGIVGASGSLYAIRTHLHRLPLPQSLSRDFAAALHAEEHGYRAVSVPESVCYVPRTGALQREYRRKVRTIERGMHTLWHKRGLLNPIRHPVFAWMLWSHKVARWALPWATLAALAALLALAPTHAWAAVLGGLALGGVLVGAAGWWLSVRGATLPRPVSILAYGLMGNAAAARAFLGLLSGGNQAVWEPTRRGVGAR